MTTIKNSSTASLRWPIVTVSHIITPLGDEEKKLLRENNVIDSQFNLFEELKTKDITGFSLLGH
jgi:hypothetical protein